MQSYLHLPKADIFSLALTIHVSVSCAICFVWYNLTLASWGPEISNKSIYLNVLITFYYLGIMFIKTVSSLIKSRFSSQVEECL